MFTIKLNLLRHFRKEPTNFCNIPFQDRGLSKGPSWFEESTKKIVNEKSNINEGDCGDLEACCEKAIGKQNEQKCFYDACSRVIWSSNL